ncbi:hypothetical protein NJ76_06270 [Rhodococcus sp. IITR03]|nr:hypothetical protein NJ76_06270 [Rhodococcus sp. IITR03]
MELQPWQSRADCRLIDPSIFFPPDDESRGMRQRVNGRRNGSARRAPSASPAATTRWKPANVTGSGEEHPNRTAAGEDRPRTALGQLTHSG